MSATLPTIDEIEAVVRRLIREELAAKGAGSGTLTTEAAAEVAGVTPKTILSWINEGLNGRRLPAGFRGKRRTVRREDLEAFLAGEAPAPDRAKDLLRRVG